MDFNTFPSEDMGLSQSMDQVLSNHFDNIEKGQFDSTTFCTGKIAPELLVLLKPYPNRFTISSIRKSGL